MGVRLMVPSGASEWSEASVRAVPQTSGQQEGIVKSKQLNITGIIVSFMVLALVLCAVTAGVTRNAIVLLPGLALLPGLTFAIAQRKSGSRHG